MRCIRIFDVISELYCVLLRRRWRFEKRSLLSQHVISELLTLYLKGPLWFLLAVLCDFFLIFEGNTNPRLLTEQKRFASIEGLLEFLSTKRRTFFFKSRLLKIIKKFLNSFFAGILLKTVFQGIRVTDLVILGSVGLVRCFSIPVKKLPILRHCAALRKKISKGEG